MKNLLYVPYLRRESAPAALPNEVLFMDSGMNASQGAAYSSGAQNVPEEQNLWTSPLLPFAPNQAKYVLNDLLQYGDNVGMFGDLQAMAAGMVENERKAVKKRTSRSEMREIDLFELDGFMADELKDEGQDATVKAELEAELVAAKKAEAAQKELNRLQAAQKTLLLAWHLEGSALELDALRDSFSAGRELLLSTMGVEEDELSELMGFAGMGGLPSRTVKGAGQGATLLDDESPDATQSSGFLRQGGIGSLPDQDPFTADLAGSGLDVLRPSWRTLLESMVPFMPEDAALVTCDALMVEAMQDFGVVFNPVEGEACAAELKVLLEVFEGANCHASTAPMWHFLGYKAPVATKPWLDGERTLFAVAFAE